MNTTSPEALANVPRFKCHKQVLAFKIKEIRQSPTTVEHEGGSWEIVSDTDGIGPAIVPHDFIQKHNPQTGGYFVIYEDGYVSYSPAHAFEEGYTLISDVKDWEKLHEIMRQDFIRVCEERDQLKKELLQCASVRDEWCAEYVKVRDALKAIVDFNTPLPAGLLEQAQAALK